MIRDIRLRRVALGVFWEKVLAGIASKYPFLGRRVTVRTFIVSLIVTPFVFGGILLLEFIIVRNTDETGNKTIPARLHVHVLDQHTHQPITEVQFGWRYGCLEWGHTVWPFDYNSQFNWPPPAFTSYCNSSGEYTLEVGSIGSVTFYGMAPGYALYKANLSNLEQGYTRDYVMYMDKALPIRGMVVDETGKGIPDVDIFLNYAPKTNINKVQYARKTKESRMAISQADGSFSLPWIPEEVVQIAAYQRDCVPFDGQFFLKTLPNGRLTIQLTRCAWFTGKVTFDETPVNGGEVSILVRNAWRGQDFSLKGTVQSDGSFSFKRLPPGIMEYHYSYGSKISNSSCIGKLEMNGEKELLPGQEAAIRMEFSALPGEVSCTFPEQFKGDKGFSFLVERPETGEMIYGGGGCHYTSNDMSIPDFPSGNFILRFELATDSRNQQKWQIYEGTLKPGDKYHFDVPIPPHTSRIDYKIINPEDDNRYSAVLFSGDVPVDADEYGEWPYVEFEMYRFLGRARDNFHIVAEVWSHPWLENSYTERPFGEFICLEPGNYTLYVRSIRYQGKGCQPETRAAVQNIVIQNPDDNVQITLKLQEAERKNFNRNPRYFPCD